MEKREKAAGRLNTS